MKNRYSNLSHLDYLCEKVIRDNITYRIVHIYTNAPQYRWTDAPGEGVACVDDTARAAVVYLRDFEISGSSESRVKAEELLRFVIYMQRHDGLFYNFILNNRLEINITHANSLADKFTWWTARAVWALGIGVRALKSCNPEFAEICAQSIRKTYPHIRQFLTRYPQKESVNDRKIPLWLIYDYSDATSELLLGLVPLNKVEPDPELQEMIKLFSEGIAIMQYGSMNRFPYGVHASDKECWHDWGNSQTQALAGANILESAVFEAENFYPRILVDGWLAYISFENQDETRRFPQIAYGVRCVTVGLIRLFEATDNSVYLKMAGLAASWLTGNNVAGDPMFNLEKGYGYDGIDSGPRRNLDSGAESTIESLFSIIELEQYPEGFKWIDAQAESPVSVEKNGKHYYYRIYSIGADESTERLGVILNLTEESFRLLDGKELEAFLLS